MVGRKPNLKKSPTEKRKRVCLSINDKLQVIEKKEKGQNIKSIAKEYGIGETTVRDLIRNSENIRKYATKFDSDKGLKTRKSMKKSTYSTLDEALINWYRQQRLLNKNNVRYKAVIEKAKMLHRDFNMPGNFTASKGWWDRFRHRYGLRTKRQRGQTPKGEKDATNDFTTKFDSMVQRYELSCHQIYNASEAGLLWKCMPSKAQVVANDESFHSTKALKERITIMPCSNAAGSHKLRLAFVGKAKKPKSLKGADLRCLPVDYFNQRQAWMDTVIFKEWFHHKFVPQVRDFLMRYNLPPRAMLILEKTPSHPPAESLTSDDGNIFALFLPSNVNSQIMPCNQSIIWSLKSLYRKEVAVRSISTANMDLFYKSLNVADAIYGCARAWEKVNQEILTNSWYKIWPSLKQRKANWGLLSNYSEINNGYNSYYDNGATEILDIFKSRMGNEQVDLENILEWLSVDLDQPGYQLQDDNQLVKATVPAKVEDSTDEEEDESTHTMTHAEGVHALEQAIAYMQQFKSTPYAQILQLREMYAFAKANLDEANKHEPILSIFLPSSSSSDNINTTSEQLAPPPPTQQPPPQPPAQPQPSHASHNNHHLSSPPQHRHQVSAGVSHVASTVPLQIQSNSTPPSALHSAMSLANYNMTHMQH